MRCIYFFYHYYPRIATCENVGSFATAELESWRNTYQHLSIIVIYIHINLLQRLLTRSNWPLNASNMPRPSKKQNAQRKVFQQQRHSKQDQQQDQRQAFQFYLHGNDIFTAASSVEQINPAALLRAFNIRTGSQQFRAPPVAPAPAPAPNTRR